MAENRSRKFLSLRRRRDASRAMQPFRCARIEPLEHRHLLAAPTLGPINDVTVLGGAPLHIALDGFDPEAGPLTYTVSSTNSDLTPFVPTGNRSLKMTVQGYGDMVFELFEDRAPETTARIIDLVQSGFYDGLTFHRVIDNFMIQGGDPLGTGTGGSGIEFDDEFHLDLQHTSSGVLSMAKSRDDTNDSQFFITDTATRSLDFQHSIFGFLVEGNSVRELISSVATNGSDKPLVDVVIQSMTIINDTENAVLMLSAPEGTTGVADVTVTVTDGELLTAQRIFQVTMAPDTSQGNPYLLDITDIHTSAGVPVGFDLDGLDVEGDPIYFGAWARGDWVLPANANIQIDLDTETGQGVVTPLGGLVGVHGILVGANPTIQSTSYPYMDVDPIGWPAATAANWDFQFVPFLVDPAAPTGLELLASVDPNGDGRTSANNTPGNELRFRITGLVTGAEVTLFADGVQIGQSTATGNSLVIVSDGLTPLADGVHQFTTRQALRNQPMTIGNRDETVDLVSGLSTAVGLTIDTVSPVFTSTPIIGAILNTPYAYDAQTNEEPAGAMEYSLTTSPAGMTIDASTGLIAWTPQSGQGPLESVVVRAEDGAGLTTDQAFSILVNEPPQVNPIANRTVAEGTLVNFIVTAADANVPLVLGLDPGAPSGATIEPSTGEFWWTPSEAQGPGDYGITVRVTDSTGLASTETFTVTVTEVNQPPVLQPLANQTVDEGQLMQFTAQATDPDLPLNALTFSLVGGAPAGAQIDPNTGVFQWTPSEAQGPGDYNITVRVTDSAGASDEASFDVHVNEVDRSPVFAAVETQFVAPGEDLAIRVQASDPDIPTNAVRYTLEPGAPDTAAIDPTTGLLTWHIPNDSSLEVIDIGVRATELIGGEATGLSSVALVRVVPFSLRGTLIDSTINQALQGSIDSPDSSSAGDPSLFDLGSRDPSGDGGFQFEFRQAGSSNSSGLFDPLGLFGTQIGLFSSSGSHRRVGEEGLGQPINPGENDQSIRMDLQPDVSDAAIEELFESETGGRATAS